MTGKTRYKYDLMSCLDVFPKEATSEKVVVNLDTKDYLSCCMCDPYQT